MSELKLVEDKAVPYKAKGYSDERIEKRIRRILVRDELTNIWKQGGVKKR